MRRIAGRCYFCGDPSMGEWFCAAHIWALGVPGAMKNGLERFERDHAFWIEKLTPEQIVVAAAYLEPAGNGAPT